MAIRNIVKIDEDKCNGCGDCVPSCAEGAIEVIDGKAKLIKEIYCDGLGACLGHCPQDAITIEQRDADEFDEKATEEHLAKSAPKEPEPACSCPGSMSRTLSPKPDAAAGTSQSATSQLAQWPVQLTLVSPQAPYFKNADVLLVADCVPFAMADFHSKLLAGSSIAIACPKLDNVDPYIEKLAQLIKSNDLKSFTVVHMQVPCCSGLTYIAQQSIKNSGLKIPFTDITISLEGQVLNTQTIEA